MSALDEALRYAAAGMAIFPVNARGAPLTAHGVKDASSDPEVIKAWRERWPGCDFGWAVPADVVVVDLDEKHGKHGLRDFRERAGCDPHEVATPQATTPSGGLHIVFKASKPYKNLAPAIPGTGVDTRTAGGYVVLPQDDNGRENGSGPLIGPDSRYGPAPAGAGHARHALCARARPLSPLMEPTSLDHPGPALGDRTSVGRSMGAEEGAGAARAGVRQGPYRPLRRPG